MRECLPVDVVLFPALQPIVFTVSTLFSETCPRMASPSCDDYHAKRALLLACSLLGNPLVDPYMPTAATMQAAAQQQMQGRYDGMSLLAAQQQAAQQHGQAPLQQPELAYAQGRTVHFDGRNAIRTASSSSNLGGRMMGSSGSHLVSS